MAQRIGFELEIETDKSTIDTLSEVELQLHNINKEIREARKEGKTDVYKTLRKQQQDLRVEAKKLRNDLRQQKLELVDLVDNFRIGFVRIGDFRAGLSNTQKALKVLTSATKTQITVQKALKAVLISSGVGALVVALGSLVAWLTQTQAGIDLVNRTMASLNAGVSVVVDTFARLFSEGFSAFDNFGGRIKEAVVDTNALVKEQQAMREEQRALEVETEKVRTREKELSKIAEDTSKSNQERAEAAAEGIRIEQELLEKREDFLNRRLVNLKREIELQGSLAKAEDLDRIADLEKEIADVREESVERQTTLNSKLNVANQALSKTTEEIKVAVEGSITSLTEKLGKLNEEVQSGALTGNALRDKLQEIIDLEGEIDNLNKKIEETRNRISDGDRDVSLSSPLDTRDSSITGGGEDSLAQEQRDRNLEAEKKYQEELIAIKTDAAQQEVDLRTAAYENLAALSGAFASGEIESAKDFARESLNVIVDLLLAQLRARLAAAKAAALLDPNPIARARALAGIVAGQVAIAALSGIAKGALSKLEEGGVVNPGFVASGPRHAHGGIPIGNGQEIEGGEPVLTRRAAQLFPNQINAINMAAGGRKILQDGGILGTAGPVLPSAALGNGTAIIDEASIKMIEAAVARGAAAGLDAAVRRSERQQELENRNVA